MNNAFGLKRKTEQSIVQAQKLIAGGDYAAAEQILKTALDVWRSSSGPKQDEGPLILGLGKCLEAQRKYEDAYELYMESLNNLTGKTYDDVYTSFLYLNERMGTFTKKDY